MNNIALYQSLNLIRTADELKPFLDWLKDQRERSRDRLETLSGDAYLIEQGVARTYKLIYERIENALEILENTKKS